MDQRDCNEELVKASMLRYAAGWLIFRFGLLLCISLYPVYGVDNTLGKSQVILFLIIAVIYFVLRLPKGDASVAEKNRKFEREKVGEPL